MTFQQTQFCDLRKHRVFIIFSNIKQPYFFPDAPLKADSMLSTTVLPISTWLQRAQ